MYLASIGLTVFLATTSDLPEPPDPGSEAITALEWLKTADAAADAQRDIASGELHLMGVSGQAVMIPQAEALRFTMCYSGHASLTLVGRGGCIIWNEKHARLIELAHNYALAYNTLLVEYLDSTGRTDCSASVDWDGAWNAIESYLRTGRHFERGTSSIGRDQIHVWANRFASHTRLAASVCDLLHAHNLDRRISVVVTPRKFINTDRESEKAYTLVCNPTGTKPNHRVNLPVRAVTGRACARPAPARPAGYADR